MKKTYEKAASLIITALLILSFTSCSMFRPIGSYTETASPTHTSGNTTETTPSTSSPTYPSSTTDPTSVTSDITETKTDEPITEARISFLGVGDNIIYYGNTREALSFADGSGRTFNFKPMYSGVADMIKNADISFINQETQMTGGELSYYPQFNSPQDLGYDLAEIGFDVINIANNHMLDCYSAGLSNTISFLKSIDGITVTGGYENEEDFKPRYIERNGIKVAFLSYCEHTNGIEPSGNSPVIPYFRGYFKAMDDDAIKEKIASQIGEAKESADLVIVSVHWGDENSYTVNVKQKEYAQFFADCGADAIIGHHPHVLQKIEWLTSSSGEKTLCVYSLGNFLSEQANDFNMLGGMINFDIVKFGSETHIENVVLEPTVTYFTTSFYQNNVFLLSDFTDELASTHGIITYDYSYGYSDSHHMTVSELSSIVKTIIAPEFLPDYLK